MKAKYSGKKSYPFWNRVNALNGGNHQELYSLGVALQNLESYVLKSLIEAEKWEKLTHKSK